MVVDAFLLVRLLGFFLFFFLISARRVSYFMSLICFSPLIVNQQ